MVCTTCAADLEVFWSSLNKQIKSWRPWKKFNLTFTILYIFCVMDVDMYFVMFFFCICYSFIAFLPCAFCNALFRDVVLFNTFIITLKVFTYGAFQLWKLMFYSVYPTDISVDNAPFYANESYQVLLVINKSMLMEAH